MRLAIAITVVLLLQATVSAQGNPNIEHGRGLGSVMFTIDIETPTGDDRCMGLEFDGAHYWVSGARDLSKTYLYELTSTGTLINTYEQPATHWGGWGWRDLAFDGEFLYAGNPNVGLIQQIDCANGQVTGVEYGPLPIVPCRAMGYCSLTDAFWTASFSSNLYECSRDNTYNGYPNPGVTMYGVAFEESNPSHPMGWWVGIDGSDGVAMEFDPGTAQFTGKSFMLGGTPAGACAYDTGRGKWVLAVIVEGAPDRIIGYDLDAESDPLEIDVDVFPSWRGGTINFYLNAGPSHANRFYGIFASATGHSPGTPLPGGAVTLPLNWDFFTEFFYSLMLPGFLDYLDNQGSATVPLTLAPFDLVDEVPLTFAYALRGPPWDMASNHVTLLVKADYRHDDGSTEGSVLTMMGGDLCRMHVFDTMGGGPDTIKAVSVAWGSPVYPGYYPGNGTPSKVFVWEDPNDDGDPSDCVLLGSKDMVVQNVDTDLLTEVVLDSPVVVENSFFVGTVINYPPGSSVLGIDSDSPGGRSGWIGGNAGGTFDPVDMGDNFFYELSGIGFPGCFLLRAIP